MSQEGGTATREPKVAYPTKFSGNRKTLKNFILAVETVFKLQPSRFPTEEIKVTFTGSLLEGHALTHYRNLATSTEPEAEAKLTNYDLFKKDLELTFGNPFEQATAQRELSRLFQGNKPAATYATEFRRISQETKFGTETLVYMFRMGLKKEIQDALAYNDKEYSNLDELIRYAIKVDNRLYESKIGRVGGPTLSNPVRAPRPGSITIPRRYSGNRSPPPTPETASGPQPMDWELGALSNQAPTRAKLSESERKHRFENNLCLYCGKSGHRVRDCPNKNRNNATQGKANSSLKSVRFQ